MNMQFSPLKMINETGSLQTLDEDIFEILKEKPETRINDNLLTYALYEKHNPDFLKLTYGEVLKKEAHYAPDEIVRRRRLVQYVYPQLRGSK